VVTWIVRDNVELRIVTVTWSVAVTGLSDNRGAATVARTPYAETPESTKAGEEQALQRKLARPLGAELGERPTKQDRRRLDALRRSQRRS